MSDKYLKIVSNKSVTQINHSRWYLADADNHIQELTEEEAKSIFVELVVDVFTVVGHQLPRNKNFKSKQP